MTLFIRVGVLLVHTKLWMSHISLSNWHVAIYLYTWAFFPHPCQLTYSRSSLSLYLSLDTQGKRKKGRDGGRGWAKHKESCNLFTFLSSTVWKCRTLAGFVGYGQSMHCKASCCLLRWLHLHKISLFYLSLGPFSSQKFSCATVTSNV